MILIHANRKLPTAGPLRAGLFERRLIRFRHFDGTGRVIEDELCDDLAVIRRRS